MINNQARNAKRDWRCKQKAKADVNKIREKNLVCLISLPCHSVQQQQNIQAAALCYCWGGLQVHLFVKTASTQAGVSSQRLGRAKWLISLTPRDSSWIRERLIIADFGTWHRLHDTEVVSNDCPCGWGTAKVCDAFKGRVFGGLAVNRLVDGWMCKEEDW